VKRVILARHGESERSVEGLTNGDPAVRVGLTATGREEARRLGVELRDDPIDLCVTSEFGRAQETADLALEGRTAVAEVADLGLDRFDEHGRSRLAADPIALPFPVAVKEEPSPANAGRPSRGGGDR